MDLRNYEEFQTWTMSHLSPVCVLYISGVRVLRCLRYVLGCVRCARNKHHHGYDVRLSAVRKGEVGANVRACS